MVQPTTKSVLLEDLKGCTVQLRQSFFKKGLKAKDHPFFCQSGFGCDPNATGSKIFGFFTSDGEECHIRRSDVEKILEYPVRKKDPPPKNNKDRPTKKIKPAPPPKKGKETPFERIVRIVADIVDAQGICCCGDCCTKFPVQESQSWKEWLQGYDKIEVRDLTPAVLNAAHLLGRRRNEEFNKDFGLIHIGHGQWASPDHPFAQRVLERHHATFT